MLDPHVDSFRNDSISHLLVDDNTNGARVNVEDSACSSVVVFIGHTFMDCAINYDINNVSNFVGGECFRDMYGTVLFESFFKLMSGSSLVAVAVGHD